MVSQGSADLEVEQEEEVEEGGAAVGGHASKPWPPALTPSWYVDNRISVIASLYFTCLQGNNNNNNDVVLQQLSMTTEPGHNKEEGGEVEEEDEAMQNTVVLFSNTDKFVLLQVQRCPFTFPFTRDICLHLPGPEQKDVKDCEL